MDDKLIKLVIKSGVELMAKTIPKWLMERYSLLWIKFGTAEFSFSEASYALSNEEMVSQVLSKLRKAGWLTAELNPQDSRKRIYHLNRPESVIKGIAEGENEDE